MDEYKKTYNFETRKSHIQKILEKYPDKIPIYLSKGRFNKTMNEYKKKKFLVNEDMKMMIFLGTIKNNYKIDSNQSLYLMVNDKEMVEMSQSLGTIYKKHKDEDGLLYISYYEENVFGV